MNTNLKLDRQVVLTICVLLTAMWLPLTTFAQDLPKSGDALQGAKARTEHCAHCQTMHHSTMHHSENLRDCQHSSDPLAYLRGSKNGIIEKGVGFAETDPANQGSLDISNISQSFDVQVQRASVGFAETDPVHQSSVYDLAISPDSEDRMRQVEVGFAETDPAGIPNRPGEIDSQHLVDCAHENGKSMVHVTAGFPSPSREGYCHVHC